MVLSIKIITSFKNKTKQNKTKQKQTNKKTKNKKNVQMYLSI